MPEIGTLDELEKLIGSYVKIDDDRGFKIKGTLSDIQPEIPYVEVLNANVMFPVPEKPPNGLEIKNLHRLDYNIDHFTFCFGSSQLVNFAVNGETYTYKPVK